MAGIGSINSSGYGTTISLADVTESENKKSAAAAYIARMDARRSGTVSGQKNAATSAPIVQAALKKAMQEISEKEKGRVTFTKIAERRQDLEATFTKSMREGLQKAGLPKDTVFTLSLSTEGNIAVQCDNKDSKAAIEKFLSGNRKLCEDFGYIQALGSVQKADQKAAAFGLASLSKSKADIQASSVESFFNTSLQNGFTPTALNAAFTEGESAAFYSGVSALV